MANQNPEQAARDLIATNFSIETDDFNQCGDMKNPRSKSGAFLMLNPSNSMELVLNPSNSRGLNFENADKRMKSGLISFCKHIY